MVQELPLIFRGSLNGREEERMCNQGGGFLRKMVRLFKKKIGNAQHRHRGGGTHKKTVA